MMEKKLIFDKVRTIISQGTRGRILASNIDLSVDLVADMGLDSMESLELSLMIEEAFSIRIADDDLNREFFRNLNNLIDYIQVKRQAL